MRLSYDAVITSERSGYRVDWLVRIVVAVRGCEYNPHSYLHHI